MGDDSPLRMFVRGWTWKARMWNGAEFQWWTSSSQTTRAAARKALLGIANGDYPEKDGMTIYENKDIDRLWRTR